MGQHESKLFTSFVQASRNLRIDGMIIMEGKMPRAGTTAKTSQIHSNHVGARPHKLISRK